MDKNLPPELKQMKEEYDFLHKKIGELEWEMATMYLNRIGVRRSDIDLLEDQLENYRNSMGLLIEKVKNYISDSKNSKNPRHQ